MSENYSYLFASHEEAIKYFDNNKNLITEGEYIACQDGDCMVIWKWIKIPGTDDIKLFDRWPLGN